MDIAKDCNGYIINKGDSVCLLHEDAPIAYLIRDIAFFGKDKACLSLLGVGGLVNAEETMLITPEDYPHYFV